MMIHDFRKYSFSIAAEPVVEEVVVVVNSSSRKVIQAVVTPILLLVPAANLVGISTGAVMA